MPDTGPLKLTRGCKVFNPQHGQLLLTGVSVPQCTRDYPGSTGPPDTPAQGLCPHAELQREHDSTSTHVLRGRALSAVLRHHSALWKGEREREGGKTEEEAGKRGQRDGRRGGRGMAGRKGDRGGRR